MARNVLVTEYLGIVGLSSVLVDSYVEGLIHPLEYAYKLVRYMGRLDVTRAHLLLFSQTVGLNDTDIVDFKKGQTRLAALDEKLTDFHRVHPDAPVIRTGVDESTPRDPSQVQ